MESLFGSIIMVERIDPRQAWQPYRPTLADPWDLKKVGHLYRRAGFGATLKELEAGLAEGPQRTIDRLLAGGDDRPVEELCTAMTRTVGQSNLADQLAPLWLYRMLYSAHPLREKLTLFWHNHFATSNLKVQNAGYMLRQNDLMRRHAQGSFRTLLTEMSSDPAMMVWLDTVQSRRGQPNENYARELMELFSLGINHPRKPEQRNYTEDDIREAARAFTGWQVQRGQPIFQANQHDDTDKTVLGQRGRWNGNDVVRICLDHEAAPFFLVRKLFRFLISDTLPASTELLEPLAQEFRKSDYHFGNLVERMLRSNLFFSPQAYRSKIKSPVEFALGIARALEAHLPDGDRHSSLGTQELSRAMEGLGQKLFYPPSVAGWDGGRAWLNGQTFLLREHLALALTSTTDNRFGSHADPARLVNRYSPKDPAEFFLKVFLQGDLPGPAFQRLAEYLKQASRQAYPVFWTAQDAQDQRLRTLCHLVLCLPEFHLN